ncbi:PHA accumulation regulator DNA-binding-like protein [Leptolyngbya sp. NIES-3755]|nr:PHA accumulation regulator DNA-binding-like protein [Leptolyngbya sp. NIES-3755]
MKRQNSLNSQATVGGFTLIEVLVTLLLIGILFAIAAPRWLAFLNQQRVGSARSQVAQAIRNAQSDAQRTKTSRAIVFQNNNNQPRYAIVSAPSNAVNVSQINNWQRLGDGNIQPGSIRLWGDQGTDPRNPAPLIFDSYGSVVTSVLPSRELPYTITIGATTSTEPRRCVAVVTLIGALREGSDATATSPQGCPTLPV